VDALKRRDTGISRRHAIDMATGIGAFQSLGRATYL